MAEQVQANGDRHQLRDALLVQEIHPQVFERGSRVIQAMAERGESEVLEVHLALLVERLPGLCHLLLSLMRRS